MIKQIDVREAFHELEKSSIFKENNLICENYATAILINVNKTPHIAVKMINGELIEKQVKCIVE